MPRLRPSGDQWKERICSRSKLVIRRPNPRDGRGTLAEMTEAGRSVMQAATDDLMKAEFGMGGYSPRELEDMFGLLRSLRVTAGDFKDR